MKATTEYARNELEERFISPEIITKIFGIKYPPGARKILEETFPDEEFIDYLAGNHGMLIAGPWEIINCYEIAGLNPSYIQLDVGQSCDSDILCNETIGPAWLAFSKFSSNAEYHYGTLEKQQDYFFKNNSKNGRRKEGFLSVSEMLWAIGAVSSVNKMKGAYSFSRQNAFEARTGTNSGFDGRKIVVHMNREGEITAGNGCPNERKMCLCTKFIQQLL